MEERFAVQLAAELHTTILDPIARSPAVEVLKGGTVGAVETPGIERARAAELIVKLGNWSNNRLVADLCERLTKIEGVSKRNTPQRCYLKLGGGTLASLGLENSAPVVEFITREEDYAAAHGSSFVRPHPQPTMAKRGWLQARPAAQADIDKLYGWIAAYAASGGKPQA